jgi:CBS domain-containing protein
MRMPTVSRYMTRSPHAVASRDKLSTARDVMRHYQIRHLPVIDDRTLVGVVSDRDLRDFDGQDDQVADAMTQQMVQVQATTALDEVIALMQTGHVNAVVVTGLEGVEGIFTSTDALRAFSDVLQRADEAER